MGPARLGAVHVRASQHLDKLEIILDRRPLREEADAPWNAEHASAIRGLVEAGGSEVHVAAYLYRVLREIDKPAPPLTGLRRAC